MNNSYNNNNNNGNRSFNQHQERKPITSYSFKGLMNDKLIGMMTDKEKNWVVNVQMLQLQIDDPYTYDYYYTVYMIYICFRR
jgi:DNA topoisomerase 2-associated protein PAT1